MIEFRQASKRYGGQVVLDRVDFRLLAGERAGIVGPNGAGKSTIFDLIVGESELDSGAVERAKDIRIGHLRQQLKPGEEQTPVQAYVEKAAPDLETVRAEIHHIEARLAEGEDAEARLLLRRLGELQTQFEVQGGYDLHARAAAALTGLGFRVADLQRPLGEFSGGWQMRAELARALIAEPDLLLLDEPSNYLDLPAVEWLKRRLEGFRGTLAMISHDRYLLESLCEITLEVAAGRVTRYPGRYAWYAEEREKRREISLARQANEDRRREQIERFVERFRAKNTMSSRVQSRVKMLEKLVLLEVDEEDTSALRLKFPPSPRSGNYPVTMDAVGKTYGDKTVFSNASLTIERGDKVAFVGKNGEGKSTLVKCIMKEIEHDGTLTLGHNVQIGYFAQNQASMLDENLTVFQTIDDVAVGDIRNKIRDLLGAFMFGGPEESMKKVKVLSGGERTRLAMIKLLLEPVNLLILDEPTNHLDLKTKDILKQALVDFDGTLIVVSHDRDFLDGLVTKVYEFGNKRVTEHLCGIYEFLEKKKMDSLNELEKK